MMHPFLARQIRRFRLEENESLRPVFDSVSRLLEDVDRNRMLDEVAMQALSSELQERLEESGRSEQRYRRLFHQSPIAMIALRVDGFVVESWNHEAEHLFGYGPMEVLGRTITELQLAAVEDCPMVEHIGGMPQGGTCAMETTMRHRDGSPREVHVTLQHLDLGDRPSIVLHIYDLTERKRAARRQQESDARFRAFFEYAGVAIHVLSYDGVILEANPAADALLGYDAGELVGRSATSLSPDEDVEATRDMGRELRSGLRESVTVERRFFHKDGHIVWGQLTMSRIHQGGEARFIGMIQDISERKRMEAELIRQAFNDELTGLANRALFGDRLRHALARRARHGTDVAVLLLDLDGFKRVNDSLGHAAGDLLLRAIGERLQAVIRSGDTAARLGGDEFAILLDQIEGEEKARQLADRLAEAIARPVSIGSRDVSVGVSIGFKLASPDDDDVTLLRDADAAMYAAKSAGRGVVRRFDPAMHQDALDWLELEGDLREAIEFGKLHLAFQPLVQLSDNRLVGAEALVRWHHPERAEVPPSAFLPIAESTGLIVPLGHWVLRHACHEAVRLGALTGVPFVMSVNLASRQLDEPDIVDVVRDALHDSGLPADRLVLELTESDIMRHPERALHLLNQIRRLGVHIAIDDFGTGYSSLSYLQFLPFDEIKIDQSFVQRVEEGERDRALIGTIVQLARSLGAVVVAEGIETPGQIEHLKALQCDIGQGYLYSRAVPADQFAGLLSSMGNPSASQGHG
jgi:diguanylate cyclase (GGDEF)-like protein/PAS domain S-box-containing protein